MMKTGTTNSTRSPWSNLGNVYFTHKTEENFKIHITLEGINSFRQNYESIKIIYDHVDDHSLFLSRSTND